MDDIFSIFTQEMGDPIYRQEVPASSLDYYRKKLPNQLLKYWAEHGWCGYGDGIFWTVNPRDYEGVVASWIDGSALEKRDNYHLIARSAFGDLYLWGERSGFSVTIDSPVSRYTGENVDLSIGGLDRDVQNFFLSIDKESNDFDELFEPARKKLGTLEHDEMYGFVPALAFGGPINVANLKKVKTVEHLILLSQISTLEPYSFSDF